MAAVTRQVYIISDLHLGGVYPGPDEPGGRGFRICTRPDAVAAFVRQLAARPADAPAVELVINGDMVDFLAERHERGAPWRAFNPDPKEAVALLRTIVARDRQVFDAMADFLRAGHRMVVLLGNHDVELALPQVRETLMELLDARGRDFAFIHDGEAYVVGDALIEHGNEYDLWNRVNFAQLRRLRAQVSRGKEADTELFEPPAGSFMVEEVINPVKEHYKFVDLLKPETSACFPLLLALDPGYKPMLTKVVKNRTKAAEIAARRKAVQQLGGDIRAGGGQPMSLGQDISGAGGGSLGSLGAGGGAAAAPAANDIVPEPSLEEELEAVLGDDAEDFRDSFLEASDDPESQLGGDISASGRISQLWGGLRLAFGSGSDEEAVRKRLPALRSALRAAQGDGSFDRSKEAKAEYWEAARELAQGPIQHVIFGHTHLPKQVRIPSKGFYLNTGTWADVLRFPQEMLEGDDDEVMERLAGFVDAMRSGDFSDFTLFRPTYVRLDVTGDGTVADAALHDWEEGASV